MARAVATLADNGDEFFPTPKPLIEKMLAGVDWTVVENVLEPSAGKGDIAQYVAMQMYEAHRMRNWRGEESFDGYSVDCIEIDPALRAVLTDRCCKGGLDGLTFVRLIHDDFLTFRGFKQYQLIVMNPPFSNGCAHLLKALDLQKDGGAIVCILNAETIRNPYTMQRKELLGLLNKYEAQIEYVSGAFLHSERPTDVEIAIVRVSIPETVEQSEIYERMKQEEGYAEPDERTTDLDVTDFIKSAVTHYNVEVKAGIELIRQYNALEPYFKDVLGDGKSYGSTLFLTAAVSGNSYIRATVNNFLKNVRRKYWTALLSNQKFIGRLTSTLQQRYQKEVGRLVNYDFSEFNISILSAEMMTHVKSGIEEEAIAMFDRLSSEHSWFEDGGKNKHYYNGWATNKAWKIGKKVILPCYGVFTSYGKYGTSASSYQAYDVLRDIEKILNFFDGNMSAEVDLQKTVESYFAQGITKGIPCKFFRAYFYKKGTVHLEFNCPELIERFNIYAAQNRGWLPPSYGKKRYRDMPEAERKVVDEFQGEKEYEKVLQNAGFYLASPTQGAAAPLMLEAGA